MAICEQNMWHWRKTPKRIKTSANTSPVLLKWHWLRMIAFCFSTVSTVSTGAVTQGLLCAKHFWKNSSLVTWQHHISIMAAPEMTRNCHRIWSKLVKCRLKTWSAPLPLGIPKDLLVVPAAVVVDWTFCHSAVAIWATQRWSLQRAPPSKRAVAKISRFFHQRLCQEVFDQFEGSMDTQLHNPNNWHRSNMHFVSRLQYTHSPSQENSHTNTVWHTLTKQFPNVKLCSALNLLVVSSVRRISTGRQGVVCRANSFALMHKTKKRIPYLVEQNRGNRYPNFEI